MEWGCAHGGGGRQADGRWWREHPNLLVEEALISQHLSRYLQIIFYEIFQDAQLFSFSE